MSLLLLSEEDSENSLSGLSVSFSESLGTVVAPQALAGGSESFSESAGTIAAVSAAAQPVIMVIS